MAAPTQHDQRVSEVHRHEWQARAHKQLGELLRLGYRAGAPVIGWAIGPVGCGLHGTITMYGKDDADTNAQRRAAYRAWVAVLSELGAVEHRPASSGRRLLAVAERVDGLCDVVLSADLREEGIGE
jgi:hypothetical protein